MTKRTVLKLFFGSLIGLAAGVVLLALAGGLALGNDVFVMNGPDVVGVRSGALGWTLLGLVGLACLVMLAAAITQFVAWIGAILNTAALQNKAWCVALLVVGLLGFVFFANLAYVIAGPDAMPGETMVSGGAILPPAAGPTADVEHQSPARQHV